jgi:hypothetical protein
MNLSQWESLPDEEILTLRAEIAGVARAHMMPPLPVPVDSESPSALKVF